MDWSKFLTRKFVAATGTSVLMAICWVLSEWLHAAREYLPGLLTALAGCLTAYTAGNVAQDHVLTRNAPRPAQPEEPTQEK